MPPIGDGRIIDRVIAKMSDILGRVAGDITHEATKTVIETKLEGLRTKGLGFGKRFLRR